MSCYFIYIVRCEDGSLYTGITTDVVRRMKEHLGQGGKGAKYTRARRPVELAALWQAPDRSTASVLEYRIKHLDREGKDALVVRPARAARLVEDVADVRTVAAKRRRSWWNDAVAMQDID